MYIYDKGMSRFGALSTVLFDMSDRWEEFTPPYILLLIRTFLTLEGVAGQVPLSLTLCVLSGLVLAPVPGCCTLNQYDCRQVSAAK